MATPSITKKQLRDPVALVDVFMSRYVFLAEAYDDMISKPDYNVAHVDRIRSDLRALESIILDTRLAELMKIIHTMQLRKETRNKD